MMPKIFDDNVVVEKIQVRLPDILLSIVDDYTREKGYSTRAECIRDLIRKQLRSEGWLK